MTANGDGQKLDIRGEQSTCCSKMTGGRKADTVAGMYEVISKQRVTNRKHGTSSPLFSPLIGCFRIESGDLSNCTGERQPLTAVISQDSGILG